MPDLSPVQKDILLERAQTIAGSVVDESSKPISGAVVQLVSLQRTNGEKQKPKERVLTDKSGSFLFDNLHGGTASLRSSTGEYCTTTSDDVETGKKDVVIVLQHGATVTGRAATVAGEAVEGATVTLQCWQGETDWSGKNNLTASTGSDGKYEVQGLEPGFYDCFCGAERLYSNMVKNVTLEAGKTAKLDFVLKTGFDLSGEVFVETDGERRGVEGAKLKASVEGFKLVSEATSAVDGTFQLENVPAGIATVELASPSKHIPDKVVRLVVISDRDVPGVEFELQMGGRVAGRVLNLDGAGVSKAKVLLRKTGFMQWSSGKKDTVSDATGYYEIDGLEAAKGYVLSASAEGYSRAKSVPFDIEAGEEKLDLDLVLAIGGSISGKVTDASNEPVSGVGISVNSSLVDFSMGDPLKAKTDSSGFYRIENVPAGQVTVICEPPEKKFDRQSLNDVMRLIETVMVREDQETEDVNFQIKSKKKADAEKVETAQTDQQTPKDEKEKTSYIRGRVLSSKGKPLPKVSIQSMSMSFGKNFGENMKFTTTDAKGAFSIEKIDPGKYMVTARGSERYGRKITEVQAPENDLTITMAGKGAISGTVVLKTDGRPVTQFTIESDSKPQHLMDSEGMLSFGKGKEFYSPRGEFRLENLDVGKQSFMVKAKGYADTQVKGIEVEEDKTTENVRVEVGEGGSVSGIVLATADDSPIEGAKVRVDVSGGNPGLALLGLTDSDKGVVFSDSEGFFQLENLNPGESTILVDHPDFAPARKSGVRVIDGEEGASVMIYLSAGGGIEGHVYAEDGQAIPMQKITAMMMEKGIQRNANTDEEGFYSMRNMEPGSYSVMLGSFMEFMVPRQGVSTKTASVREGETTEVDFGQSAAMVYGKVTRRGQTVPDAKVNIRTSEMPFGFDFNANATTDENGFYKVQGLEKGHYFVMLFEGTFAFQSVARAEVDITEDSGAYEVNLAYPETFVAGRVISATDESPIAGAEVTLAPTGGGYAEQIAMFFGGLSATTDGEGRFKVEEVPPRKYELVAKAEGYGQEAMTIDVSQSLEDVVVQLGAYGILEGVVKDANTGDPVLSMIQVNDEDGRTIATSMENLFQGAQTDGRYRIDNLSPGTYNVIAYAAQEVKYVPQVVRNVEIRSKETTTMDFSLQQGAINLIVNFVDQDGRAVTQLKAQLFNEAGEEIKELVYMVGNKLSTLVARGIYRVTVDAEGYEPEDFELDLTEQSGAYTKNVELRIKN